MVTQRTPDEVDAGIIEARVALDGGDTACAAYLLGVTVEDVERVSDATA